MTIAIAGATGQLGRLVVAGLGARAPAAQIVALARDPGRAGDLGVPARLADYDRPETLAPALAGVESLLFISSNDVGRRLPQHDALIAAAQTAGVGRIVYTSLLHADVSAIGLGADHRHTEAAIAATGIPHVILRNGWYGENYAGAVAGALATGTLIGSAGAGRISAAARRDYADAAVAVLTAEGEDGRVYELAGDEAFTLAELAREIGRQTGRDIPYRDLPVADYAAALEGAGLPPAVAQMIAGWEVPIAADALFDEGRQLSALIGRPTATLAEMVAGLIAGG
ncbi:SDR family oxidoreductase [Flavisphingomonas formosensis]|uniref:SDR family oxidoreductase n=1 Tax=Flavisphingomonas formosensis TaxID=861534 RepID=UPI0012F80DC1|nr:SDR family oxidoreductase [Sphingomonas formosensis]